MAMSETSARSKTQGPFLGLTEGLRLLEGRFPSNEVAQRVVQAAMLQPEVAGARLWRVDNGNATVWTAVGVLPASGNNQAVAGAVINPTNDGKLWATALGSDDFRVRVLEVRGKRVLSDELRTQLDYLARFAAVVLALAERRGAMEEL